MAFEDVSQNLQYRKFALWEKGDFLIGKYTQLKNAGEYKGNTQWQAVIEITEDVAFDDYKGNPIEVGAKFGLPLSTSLKDYFTDDCIGNLFKVVYKGKKDNKSGDNSYHDFQVLMDSSKGGEISPAESESSDEDDFDL